jgi:3'-phosphoadenosine 5'-phosphosulfate sulfotransferase (PAPS reductase)/FAD synthetase
MNVKSDRRSLMIEHIVSFSGGKDSTAMLLMMIEKNMPITDIIFCDTGMEFEEMYQHIDKVENYINRKITVLKSEKTFEYLLGEHVKKNGGVGYGWPDFKNRWCTQVLKKSVVSKYLKGKNIVEYHGIADDEKERTEKNKEGNRIIKYPLVN